MKPIIEFYFDFLSPYSYLAWQWLRKNREHFCFEYYPVIMGHVIHHYETKGPAEIKPKREYLSKYCLRYSRLNGVPFTWPEKIPFNSLYALRMALKVSAGSEQFEVIDLIFRSGWGKGMDIGDPDILLRELNKVDLDGERLMECVASKESRLALKNNVKRAQSKAVFGVPSFIVDGELFWGNDSTEHLELHLAGKDPLDQKSFRLFVESFRTESHPPYN